jgi:hypothetical protein
MNDRYCVKRQQLRKQQPADDDVAEGLLDLRAGPVPTIVGTPPSSDAEARRQLNDLPIKETTASISGHPAPAPPTSRVRTGFLSNDGVLNAETCRGGGAACAAPSMDQ